eukprot:2988891-Pleurochrysis_carterae.AAC.1
MSWTLTRRKRTGRSRIRRRYGCRLTRPWTTANAWLMSCGDDPEANMASGEGAGMPDERQCNLASLNLSELAGELKLLLHAAAIGED